MGAECCGLFTSPPHPHPHSILFQTAPAFPAGLVCRGRIWRLRFRGSPSGSGCSGGGRWGRRWLRGSILRPKKGPGGEFIFGKLFHKDIEGLAAGLELLVLGEALVDRKD
jgi:hypothetical protein